ncbi:MAG: hypothetical protein E6G77_11435 [Alphaproteobacteria bacterium]|nr:MAG: hypothetical protein E6G77_11435 [Alphaproteobacteria bacterium]
MDQRNISGDYDVLLDLVKSRASVRELKPDPIPDEYVTQILEVGRWAMSGANGQPWERMFVRRVVLAALLATIALWPGGPALALEKVRLGTAGARGGRRRCRSGVWPGARLSRQGGAGDRGCCHVWTAGQSRARAPVRQPD